MGRPEVLHSWHECVLIRYSGSADPVGMATLAEKIETETKVRQMLDDAGVPPPDWVDYGYGCIRLIFDEAKVCLVIDIDDDRDLGEQLGLEPH